MKKIILTLSLLIGASIVAHAEVTPSTTTPVLNPNVTNDVNKTMPQPAPTESSPAINNAGEGSGDEPDTLDADTQEDPDPEADDLENETPDVGAAPAQKS